MKNLIAKLKNKIRKRFDEISFEDFLENTKKYSYEVKDKFKTKIKKRFDLISFENFLEKSKKYSYKIKDKLKLKFSTVYDEKDAIGRRYRRQDAIGTPFCVTIDHQTIEDDTVTIRDRDSMKQDRIHVNEIHSFLDSSLDINNWLLNSD